MTALSEDLKARKVWAVGSPVPDSLLGVYKVPLSTGETMVFELAKEAYAFCLLYPEPEYTPDDADYLEYDDGEPSTDPGQPSSARSPTD